MENSHELPMGKVKVLMGCRELELQASRIYHFFASHFRKDPLQLLFWRKMALEEENHANQFSLAIRLKEDLVKDLRIDDLQTLDALKLATEVLEAVEKEPPSLEKALLLAIEMEEKFVAFHMHSIGTFNGEKYDSLFSSMMDADEDHVNQLWEQYNELIAEQKGKLVRIPRRDP